MNRAPNATSAKLGTFAGVFTPSILTILGLILFLRTGYVVGEVGLLRVLAIVAMANGISIFTSVSLSAIATNLKVKGGGDYYLISRTLGVEFGGALGLVLFAAQSISIAFYVIGFGEAVASAVPGEQGDMFVRGTALAAVAVLFVFAWLGSDWATKLQYVIMAVLGVALFDFFFSGVADFDFTLLKGNLQPSGQMSYWAAFALFFPAVTGFTQGVSMSGDLEDPGKSLPRGTFLAVYISFAIYLAVCVLFAGSMTGAELTQDFEAMRRASRVAWLIDAGVVAATLSSALASFMGAPRILQSLARDRVFPVLSPFAVGVGESDNPRRGVLLALAVAAAGVMLGDLNVIAPIVTMFFLISYGLLNYATYHESGAKSPSFRPRFRWFDRRYALAGAIGCGGAILAIHPLAGALAFGVLMAIRLYISHTDRPDRWSDSTRSARFQRVREDLHRMDRELEHARDWRPSILAFSDAQPRRERLLRFATWLEGGSGMTTMVRMLPGEGAVARKKRQEAEEELRAEIARLELDAFARVVLSNDVEQTLPVLLAGYGLGPIRANTVLLNWFDQQRPDGEQAGLRSYGRVLRMALRGGCNVIMLHAMNEVLPTLAEVPSADRRIDVWWEGDDKSRLSLLLAYLVGRNEAWEESRLRVLATVDEAADEAQVLAELNAMLDDVRIDAEAVVVRSVDAETVVETSRDASLVFLGLRLKDDALRLTFDAPEGGLGALLERLPLCALVLAAHEVVLDSQPDEGPHAALAGLQDAAHKSLKNAELTARELADAERALEKARVALGELCARQGKREDVARAEAAIKESEAALPELRRRAAKARGKADLAQREVEALESQSRAPVPSEGVERMERNDDPKP